MAFMYLKEITIQGFKTFAQKTTLRFLDPKAHGHAITAIVGPNGSGKSNIADAIRWVLGEQSMKLLRGKAATDVIFSGSQGKARAGFAEVELIFADVRGIEGIEFSEMHLARRLYRDGESTYIFNGQTVRLQDVQLFLAQANVGQQSYSVIGQGQIDHILAASPQERKQFFDDATGVKPLQLKRHRARLKLARTRENLGQIELLIQEIEPRLRMLKRLVRRREQRETIEKELQEAHVQYFGTLWREVSEHIKTEAGAFARAEEAAKKQAAILDQERSKLNTLQAQTKTSGDPVTLELTELQQRYDELQDKRTRSREEWFEAQKQLELSRVKSVSTWTPLPLSQIIERLVSIHDAARALKTALKSDVLNEDAVDALVTASEGLLSRLQKPAPEAAKPDTALQKKLETLKQHEAKIVTELTALKQTLHDRAEQSQEERAEFFALQNRLLSAQDKLHSLETTLNERRVALARLETRREDLEKDMNEALGTLTQTARQFKGGANTEALYPRLQQLRHTLDVIGGIDEETVKDYDETNERHAFLENQVADLVGALRETESLIDELDTHIKVQSKRQFESIEHHFEHYFKILFGGGTCALKEIHASDIEEEAPDENAPEQEERVPTDRDQVVGIDIQATPPGKRLKSINLLSGGERALTSIALVCAIMATNPSP
ncbi:AAA family ATPase, partial [Candidatus Uhrbacteria bacterium]|nr:AAA family ATPase [Candidatus Uhrbacteria bacterium]